jgi:putative peptidoglycan lipid II flippase
MIKGFRQIASLTAASRVLGFIRDMAYSHFFGADQLLDAWIVAFRIPNLSRRLFGEGAASASLIPVYSEALYKDREEAAKLINTVLTVLFVILAALVLAGEAGIWLYYRFLARTTESRLIMSLSSVMLPYMIFVCVAAVLAGILNVHRHFAAPAAAPIVLNILIIGAILCSGWWLNVKVRQQLFLVAVAVRWSGVSIRPAWQVHSESFKKILFLMGPMILGLTATQINTLADDLIAWWFSGSVEKGAFFQLLGAQIQYPMWRGSVSHLYYAQRLYQLPLGVLGISLATAIFPVMSDDAARKDFAALRTTISKAISATIFVALPATVGLIIIARPLISAAFEHGKFTPQDTNMVVKTLIFYALGLCGYFAQQILARAFYSIQDSKVPMQSALVAVFVNAVLNLTLIWFMGCAGLACSTAVCSYLQVVILIIVLGRKLEHTILDGLSVTLMKTLAATGLMSLAAATIMILTRSLPHVRSFDILRLAAVVPTSAAVYLLAAKFLRIEMLSLLKSGKKAESQNWQQET